MVRFMYCHIAKKKDNLAVLGRVILGESVIYENYMGLITRRNPKTETDIICDICQFITLLFPKRLNSLKHIAK